MEDKKERTKTKSKRSRLTRTIRTDVEAIAFERDIGEYVIQVGIIDATPSGVRGVSVVLSSTQQMRESLVYVQQEVWFG